MKAPSTSESLKLVAGMLGLGSEFNDFLTCLPVYLYLRGNHPIWLTNIFFWVAQPRTSSTSSRSLNWFSFWIILAFTKHHWGTEEARMVTTVSPLRSDGLEPDFKKMWETSVFLFLLIGWVVHVPKTRSYPSMFEMMNWNLQIWKIYGLYTEAWLRWIWYSPWEYLASD